MAIITNPYPNSVRMRSHSTYSNTTTTTIKISFRTTGEAMKLKNRFHAGWLFFAFRPDLNLLLALDTAYAPNLTVPSCKNPELQYLNPKQIPNPDFKIQNLSILVIGVLSLDIV